MRIDERAENEENIFGNLCTNTGAQKLSLVLAKVFHLLNGNATHAKMQSFCFYCLVMIIDSGIHRRKNKT